MRFKRPLVALSIVGLGSLGFMAAIFGFQTAPAAGSVSVAKATVVTVTAGKPAEFKFTVSPNSALPWAVKTPSGSVTFKVTNKGALPHNFKICTSPTTSTSAKLITCNGTSTKLLKPGQSTSLTIIFKQRGKYEFLCTVAGHAAAGMKGLIGVGVKLVTTTSTVVKTTTTVKTSTSATTTSGTGETLLGNPVNGKALFISNSCGSCHTLADAGTNGNVGPNLNQLKPSQITVKTAVMNGAGGGGSQMPPFAMSATQFNDIASYVYSATH